jgi:hypothetical protein
MFKNKASLKLRLQCIKEAEFSSRQVNNLYEIFCRLLMKTSALDMKYAGKATVQCRMVLRETGCHKSLYIPHKFNKYIHRMYLIITVAIFVIYQ